MYFFNLPYIASEELSIGNMRFTTFDLGGHTQGKLAKPAAKGTHWKSFSHQVLSLNS